MPSLAFPKEASFVEHSTNFVWVAEANDDEDRAILESKDNAPRVSADLALYFPLCEVASIELEASDTAGTL